MPTEKPIILVDGSSYLYRAFHALPELKTATGQATGAIYGVINMLQKVITDYAPENLAVIFDAKGKNFRHELYPEYKAHRPPMPEDLISQIQLLHEIIHAMGIPLLIISGVEADDVIGTIAKKMSAIDKQVIVVTGDKDMVQLVDHNITLLNTMTNTKLDYAGVKVKLGICPEQFIDYLTLVGDTSDNIVGVPGVGPKTAVKLLNDYHTLDGIVTHATEIKGKLGETLRANLHRLPLIKTLVTIKDDLDNLGKVQNSQNLLTDLKLKTADNAKLIDLFTKLEFKNWLNKLRAIEHLTQQPAVSNISPQQIITTNQDLENWINNLASTQTLAIDIRTADPENSQSNIIGITLTLAPQENAAIHIPIIQTDIPDPLNIDLVLAKLKPVLINPLQKKLGHNSKRTMNILFNHGIKLQGVFFDVMLAAYILNNTSNQYDLDTLALKYLGIMLPKSPDLTNSTTVEAATYAITYTTVIWQLYDTLWPKIKADEKLQHVFTDIDMPTLVTLANVEQNGVCIDIAFLHTYSQILAEKLTILEQEAYKLAGQAFNLNSPQQLQEILFGKLGLPVIHKTPKGQPSTAEQTLQELALNFPLPKVILEYRTINKLKSTYTDSLPQQVNPKTQRIHTSYNQTITTTGRLSSTNPNLQNIPIRTEGGRKIRQAFIVPPGHKIISADYSQIELRVMAHIAGDEGLIAAFRNNIDIHTATAAEIFDVPTTAVTDEQRRNAKTINFGLIYGMSAFGLAQRLGIPQSFAKKYIDLYFQRYPKVKLYMDSTRKQAHEQGHLETISGRKIYIAEIDSSNFMRRAAAERAAINAPIQGSAADIMKIAMINIDTWLQQEQPATKMIMQVHDELVFETTTPINPDLISGIKFRMETAIQLIVPIEAHIGIGDNWDEAH